MPEFIAEIRIPITAVNMEHAEETVDRLVAAMKQRMGSALRDVHIDNVRPMEGD